MAQKRTAEGDAQTEPRRSSRLRGLAAAAAAASAAPAEAAPAPAPTKPAAKPKRTAKPAAAKPEPKRRAAAAASAAGAASSSEEEEPAGPAPVEDDAADRPGRLLLADVAAEVGDVVLVSAADFEQAEAEKTSARFEVAGRTASLLSLVPDEKKGLVVFMYPKASTPGCTRQARGFNEQLEPVRDAGYVLLGLSADSARSNGAFAKKLGLGYDLVCDPSRALVHALGFSGGAGQSKTERGVVLFSRDESGALAVAESLKAGPEPTVKAVAEWVGVEV